MVQDGWHWRKVACHRTTTASVSSVRLASERLYLKKLQRKLSKKCRLHLVGLWIKFTVMLNMSGSFWCDWIYFIKLQLHNTNISNEKLLNNMFMNSTWSLLVLLFNTFHNLCDFPRMILKWMRFNVFSCMKDCMKVVCPGQGCDCLVQFPRHDYRLDKLDYPLLS